MTTRKLSYDRIATTEDTGDPVIRAELEDTGSYVNVIVAGDGIIRIANVESRYQGDMKTIVDDLVDQLETERIWFMNPLTEFGSNLEQRLHGFEKKTVDIHSPGTDVDKIEVLEGEWLMEDER